MGFNIIAPYMEFLHLNWYFAEWSLEVYKGPIIIYGRGERGQMTLYGKYFHDPLSKVASISASLPMGI